MAKQLSLPVIEAPVAPGIDLPTQTAENGVSSQGSLPVAAPTPPREKRKPSGASRRGDMTSAQYKMSKKDLASENDRLKAQLGISSPAAQPMTGDVHTGTPPASRDEKVDLMREKMIRQIAAFMACVIALLFEWIAKRRKFEGWNLTENRADQAGDLWAEYLIYCVPETLTPKELALLGAVGGTGALVSSKYQQERAAKGASSSKPSESMPDVPPPQRSPAPERPLFSSSRSA